MAFKIKKAGEDSEIGSLAVLIYAPPGVGKTTLAFSAKNPVLIDAESGGNRAIGQRDTFEAETIQTAYLDVMEFVKSPVLNNYDTIIIDSIDAFLFWIEKHIGNKTPDLLKKDGTLSLPGYGTMFALFRDFMNEAKNRKKDIIFIAHFVDSKTNEKTRITTPAGPAITGKSKALILQDMTLCGLIQFIDGTRYINFDPSYGHIAKDSAGLGVYEIANLDATKGPIEPVMQNILELTRRRLRNADRANKEVMDFLQTISAQIESAPAYQTAEHFTKLAQESANWEAHIQPSAKRFINDKAKSYGFIFDKDTKTFIVKNG